MLPVELEPLLVHKLRWASYSECLGPRRSKSGDSPHQEQHAHASRVGLRDPNCDLKAKVEAEKGGLFATYELIRFWGE